MQKNTAFGRFIIFMSLSLLLSACQTSGDRSLSRVNKSVSPGVDDMHTSSVAMKPIGTPNFSNSNNVSNLAQFQRSGDGSLTMEAAVRRAVGWHPAVDEATGRIYVADERILAAKAAYYPQFKAGMNSGYQSRDRDRWRPELHVSASQLLYDFGKTSSSIHIEEAGKNISHARLLAEVDNLSRDTASAVIQVQRYGILATLAQEQVEGVERIAALVNERTDKGASTMSDKIQADARVETALATQWQYLSELNRWQVALGSLIGGGSPKPSPEVPSWLSKACDVTSPDWDEVPVMLQAQAEKEEAKAHLAASKADGFPTVSLEASSKYDLNSLSNNSANYDRRMDYTVGINVTSSLYNGGRTSAQKRAAAFALESAEAAINRARYDVQRSLMEASSQIGTLTRLRASLETRATMMVKTRDLYREQYLELGTRTLLDLLNAEQELHESRFQIANTEHDLRQLNIGCLYSSGKIRQSFGINPDMLRGGTGI